MNVTWAVLSASVFGGTAFVLAWLLTGSFFSFIGMASAIAVGAGVGIPALFFRDVVVWFKLTITIFAMFFAALFRLLGLGLVAGNTAQGLANAFASIGSSVGSAISIFEMICKGAGEAGATFGWAYFRLYHSFAESLWSYAGISISDDIIARGIRLAAAAIFYVSMIGLFVWPSTLVPYQIETMQIIDNIHCNSIPFLKASFDSYNTIIDDFYLVYVQQPVSLFFAYVFNYVYLFWDFLVLLVFPLFDILRKVISGDPAYLTCIGTSRCSLFLVLLADGFSRRHELSWAAL